MKTIVRAARCFRLSLAACALFFGFAATDARASVAFTTATSAGYLITPQPISATSGDTMKILVVNNTGSSVSANLCMGTPDQFQKSICGTQLTYSKEGPGMAIIDTMMLNGMVLYVLKGPSGVSVNFTVTIN